MQAVRWPTGLSARKIARGMVVSDSTVRGLVAGRMANSQLTQKKSNSRADRSRAWSCGYRQCSAVGGGPVVSQVRSSQPSRGGKIGPFGCSPPAGCLTSSSSAAHFSISFLAAVSEEGRDHPCIRHCSAPKSYLERKCARAHFSAYIHRTRSATKGRPFRRHGFPSSGPPLGSGAHKLTGGDDGESMGATITTAPNI